MEAKGLKLYKILKNNQTILSETAGKYAGHRGYKIFGRLDCKSGMRMKKENRVFFHELEDAVMQGYRPCKNCKPMIEEDFQRVRKMMIHKSLESSYRSGKRFY